MLEFAVDSMPGKFSIMTSRVTNVQVLYIRKNQVCQDKSPRPNREKGL